jgi:DNA repair ATPase RecN
MANWLAWYPWALASLVVLAIIAGMTLWSSNRTKRREQAIRAFLDTADALEKDLHQCKRKMQDMESWVAKLPSEDIRRVGFSLNAESSVQEALKLLLSQRIWLRDQHESASLLQLESANANLDKSRSSLSAHMDKLENMRLELERATDTLEDAYRSQDRMRSAVIVQGSNSVH